MGFSISALSIQRWHTVFHQRSSWMRGLHSKFGFATGSRWRAPTPSACSGLQVPSSPCSNLDPSMSETTKGFLYSTMLQSTQTSHLRLQDLPDLHLFVFDLQIPRISADLFRYLRGVFLPIPLPAFEVLTFLSVFIVVPVSDVMFWTSLTVNCLRPVIS